MRIRSLLCGDIRFQYKYGFYFLYLVFSILYISLIFTFPAEWRGKAAVFLIFTDPTAMGLYFMGAIVLLERSERVLNSIAVAPVKTHEYVLSKLFSIGVISVIVGSAIGFFSNAVSMTAGFITGVLLGSCLFSALGLMIAAKSISLNGFVLSTVPVQLFIDLPAIAWLLGWRPGIMLAHPGVCLIELCENGTNALPALIILAFWTVLAVVICNGTIGRMFKTVGGVKL